MALGQAPGTWPVNSIRAVSQRFVVRLAPARTLSRILGVIAVIPRVPETPSLVSPLGKILMRQDDALYSKDFNRLARRRTRITGLTPKIRTTPSAKKEGAIIDIISRVVAFEGSSDGVREKKQTVHAAD